MPCTLTPTAYGTTLVWTHPDGTTHALRCRFRAPPVWLALWQDVGNAVTQTHPSPRHATHVQGETASTTTTKGNGSCQV